ncbi:hypothetical protein JQ544_25465 [Bradyrhizobium diazoefficiens]|nr:hypothetical protein [Bradyrhizobium diazoefficiens]MBR0814903.1 hypothetical protein [Bradyrhizobium diazoefficiens]
MSDKGTYGGFTVGFPTLAGGVGFGAYIDNSGRLYPQLYYGTPGLGLSAGYTNDLGALLTGPSAAGTLGRIGANVATVGTETGVGFGTPGVGVTYGIGPFDFSEDYSQPWIRQLIRDSAVGAGVPSRRNVLEYGYPEPDGERSPESNTVPVRRLTRVDSGDAEPVSASGSAPARYPSTFNERFGDWRGLPGGPQPSQASRPIGVFANESSASMASSMRGFDKRGDATSAASGTAGGLLGMIQDYMRSRGH